MSRSPPADEVALSRAVAREGIVIYERPCPRGTRQTSCGRKVTPMRIFPNDAALEALCRRYGIRRLSLFGSTLKRMDRPDSDVDLLVEFQPGATPSLFTMAEIELELSPLLNGRKVDLRTAGDLSRYFRDEVVRMAEPQYEA